MDSVSLNSLLLRGARIIAPDRLVQRGAVLIAADRIAQVFDVTPSDAPAAESVVDVDGLTLFPGFIDVHIHGAVGVDTMAAGAEDLRHVGEFLARNGVSAWLPTLVPAATADYRRAIDAIEQSMAQSSGADPERRSEYRLQSGLADSEKDPTEVGTLNTCRARILGVHYEGPFVNSEQCGALHREHFRTFSGAADVDSLPTIKNESAVHMMTLAPEIQGGIELVKELHKRRWIGSLGHTRATVDV